MAVQDTGDRDGTATGGETAQLLDVARVVARSAAELARAQRSAGVADVTSKSTATDLVTAADRAVERHLVARLRELRPGDAMFGEEFGAHNDPAAARVRWVLDPIDGTVNYVYGLAHYAVSVAAEVAGRTVVGVVHNAATGQQWWAVRGGGAYVGEASQDRRLYGSAVTTLDQALVATGFAYDPLRRAYQAQVVARLLPLVRDIRRFGAAALDLCLAAAGQVDAYFEQGLGAWDHAAGALIAAEAGLLVSGLRGREPGTRMVMAAPPALHVPLHDLLADLDADGGP